jgi:hypothetical protein
MAIAYSTALKNARLQDVADLIAGKTIAAATGTATAGKLVLLDGAGVTLATVALPLAPFVVAGGVATLQGVPLQATIAVSGTAAKAELRNNANAVVVSGLTVGTAGAHVTVASVALVAGELVVVTGGTITHG